MHLRTRFARATTAVFVLVAAVALCRSGAAVAAGSPRAGAAAAGTASSQPAAPQKPRLLRSDAAIDLASATAPDARQGRAQVDPDRVPVAIVPGALLDGVALLAAALVLVVAGRRRSASRRSLPSRRAPPLLL